ncbi:MAG: trypsin-like peptidase domain-containing protein [Planctomycetota bacterium]|nr:trypsin-like peptidase domain-containing protein [Planctomycetota bacterium]
MFRRALTLLVLGSALGVFFAALLGPGPVRGEEAPTELVEDPAPPTRTAKDISRPMIEATRRVRPAVVKIIGYRKDWRGRMRQSQSGSGFIISNDGHVLTNRHVILNATLLAVRTDDGRSFERVQVLGADARSDVAVIKIIAPQATKFPLAPLGDSDALEVGELVLAIGAPYELASSVSLGVVSATGRVGLIGGAYGSATSEDFIQTDAALNRGNSGGPLVNMDGQVVGINTAIQGATGANVGVGFSIPINLARSVAVSLIERGVAKRGYLGVQGQLTKAGWKVQTVVPDSPAAKAGLRRNDVITEIDGRRLRDARILLARLTQAGPGGKLDLTVQRSDMKRNVSVVLGEERLDTFGIEVESLKPARAKELGLHPQTQGVVVTRVLEKSAAAQANARNRLLPGDVITHVFWPGGRRALRAREDFDEAMRHFASTRPAEVHFIVETPEGRFRVKLTPPRPS